MGAAGQPILQVQLAPCTCAGLANSAKRQDRCVLRIVKKKVVSSSTLLLPSTSRPLPSVHNAANVETAPATPTCIRLGWYLAENNSWSVAMSWAAQETGAVSDGLDPQEQGQGRRARLLASCRRTVCWIYWYVEPDCLLVDVGPFAGSIGTLTTGPWPNNRMACLRLYLRGPVQRSVFDYLGSGLCATTWTAAVDHCLDVHVCFLYFFVSHSCHSGSADCYASKRRSAKH